jgi:hypothetical protein
VSNKVLYDESAIPINARIYGVKCMHCENEFLINACDGEFWCYRCKDYVMVESICQKIYVSRRTHVSRRS